MPELTARSANSSGVASFASTMRASPPSTSRTTRPYDRASSGSNASTVPAARALRCVSISAATVSGRSAGTSPFSTRIVPCTSARASRAARTASPVPSGRCWTATSTPGNLSAASGEVTTTTLATPASRAACTTQSTSRRPSSGCRCFGVALFIRVPRPAAITTAVTSFVMGSGKSWLGRQDSNLGSRDQNPLPYRLATPQGTARSLPAVEEEVDEAEHREDDDGHDHGPFDDPGEDHADHRQELGGGEDPEHLADEL